MAGIHEGQPPVEDDLLAEAATFYVESTLLRLSSLDAALRRRQLRNGEMVNVPTDAETVLHLDIESPLSPSQLSYWGRRELDFTLGLIVGAAIERQDDLPSVYERAVQDVVNRGSIDG